MDVRPYHYAEFQNVPLRPGKTGDLRIVTGVRGERPVVWPGPGPATEPAGVVFGPVLERVVAYRKGFPSEAVPECGPMYLDLDTGGYVEFKGLPTSGEVRKAGVDMYYEPSADGEGRRLARSNMQVQPVRWDTNPRDVDKLLTIASPYALLETRRRPLAFRTRDGGMGILQIVGPTKDGRGIRIRYKLVKTPPPAVRPSSRPAPRGASAPPAGVSRKMPGSKLSLEEVLEGDYAFVAVCEATDEAGITDRDTGVHEYGTSYQKLRIAKVLLGQKPTGAVRGFHYTVFRPYDGASGVPGLDERAIKKGERVIWVVRKVGDRFRGIKALVDTPANRATAKRLAVAPPAGSRLEFRRAPSASALGRAELKSYMDWLKAGRVGFWWKGGRLAGIAGRMPNHAWLEIAGELTNAGELVTGEYEGRKYVLVSDKPGQTMLPGEGKNAWGLAKVYPTRDGSGRLAVGFVLDNRGAELFATFTKANINRALAIVVDGKVVAAPVLRTALGKQGVITGRFTEKEIRTLVKALKAGMPPKESPATPPAGVVFGPVVERVVAYRKGFPSEAVPECGPMYLDLDTGTHVEFKGLPTSGEVRKAGVDMYYEPSADGKGMRLAGLNVQLQPVRWDTDARNVEKSIWLRRLTPYWRRGGDLWPSGPGTAEWEYYRSSAPPKTAGASESATSW